MNQKIKINSFLANFNQIFIIFKRPARFSVYKLKSSFNSLKKTNLFKRYVKMESKEHTYEFTTEQRKNLDPEEQSTFIRAFKNYDKNKDGQMDESEFKNIMIDIGMRKITDAEVKAMLGDHDQNKDGVLSWEEFVDMMNKFKGKDPSKFGAISEAGKATVTTKFGGVHQYSVEEVNTYAKLLNYMLRDDEDAKCRIPISIEDTEDIFHAFDNGILMCKLLLEIDPDCIDSRAINKKSTMNAFQIKENI